MRWRAALAWRSPPRFRRCRLVLAVPVGPAGGRRYRSFSAQRGESSLGVESFWIASSRDQQGCRGVGPYSEDADQGRRCLTGES